MLKIGFTGTQRGLSKPQRLTLQEVMRELGPFELHHGSCVGADAEAHRFARRFGARIVLHPCNITAKRAFCQGDVEHAPLPPLDRNRVIVGAIERLIACPFELIEKRRGGTWSTMRYARAANLPITVVWRDGRRWDREPGPGRLALQGQPRGRSGPEPDLFAWSGPAGHPGSS